MAGHSKFKNIMHRKGAQDKKRAKVFTKVGREIQVAAKLGDPDPANNPRLRSAVQAARAVNMPKDRIERAIKSAQGGGDGANYEEMRYEGYGPGGSAVIVEALTDNRNRTAGEVRTAFGKNGGTLGESGSVAFSFERVGSIKYPLEAGDLEKMEELAIECGANEIEDDGEFWEFITDTQDFASVKEALEAELGEAGENKLIFKPNSLTELDEAKAQTMMKMIDALEDNDDVQAVYSNFSVSDEVAAKLAEG